MDITQIYKQDNLSKFEEKFALIKEQDNTYEGKYPLQLIHESARGIYGGEFIAQGILAAWETVNREKFTPHSLHSYFIKAGAPDSVMRWEVEITNDGRTYSNRVARCYQSHTNELCFFIMVSFALDNSITGNKIKYRDNPLSIVPFEFQDDPKGLLYKYAPIIDKQPSITHTHNLLTHFFPEEYRNASPKSFHEGAIGDRWLGCFFKFNDKFELAKDPNKTKFAALGYASDNFYLATVVIAMGMPLDRELFNFFKVSMDHTIYFHDSDFEPSEWFYLAYRFPRMSNGRVLCYCELYTLDGKQIATIVQEAIARVPKAVADRALGGSYKL